MHQINDLHFGVKSCQTLTEVRSNFNIHAKLDSNVLFIEGDVSKTLRESKLPNAISILRLDTDWYASTKDELEILYPRVSRHGVLIIDDYGHWRGAQIATDEYFRQSSTNLPLMCVVDRGVRLAIKIG